MKSRDGKSQRREEKRRRKNIKKRKSPSLRRKKIQVREKVGKSRNTVFFPWFGAPEGQKSRLGKAAGAEPGKMRDAKLHAVVARSTFPSQSAQNTSASEHFWKLRCRKSARRCGAKHISKSKESKTDGFGAFWKLRCRKSARRRRRGAKHISKSKSTKHHMYAPLGPWSVVLRGRRKGLCTLSKVSKTWGFVAFPKTMAGMGHLKRICKDAFSVAGAVQKTCSWELLEGQGPDFLRAVAFWSMRSSGLLRWFCVTGAALRMTWPHFFVAGAIL